MSDDMTNADKPKVGEQQSDSTAEANKPDEARAKDKPDSGIILGGVQPKE